MNIHYFRPLQFYICILFLVSVCPPLSAQDISLSFDENGRLISQPLPRLQFPRCIKDCDNVYKLRARVLLPLDYFKEEKIKIDSMAIETFSALNDTLSMLYRILACGENEELSRLQKVVGKSSDIRKWNFSGRENDEEIVPKKLFDFVEFVGVLESLKQNAGNGQRVEELLEILNANYLDFSPFRLKVKGSQLENKCMRFTSVSASDDYCKCILPGKKYIAVEFGIPWNLIADDITPDSFQVIQYFVMKKYAIDSYNAMLDSNKNDIERLKMLQENLKTNTGEVSQILDAFNKLDFIRETCVGEDRQTQITAVQKKIDELSKKLNKKLGEFDCKTTCNSDNILFCSPVLPKWILKLVWLNGDLIRLNPFSFTNKKINIAEIKPEDSKGQLSESDMALAIKDDSIKISFWTTAISHFQDSVLRDKKIDIETAKIGIAQLINERDTAQRDLDSKLAQKKKSEQSKSNNKDVNKKNGDEMEAFLTIAKVKYKGWLVPFSDSKAIHDKWWLRNYNYNGTTGLTSEDKFKFTYPENENLTLLIHNLSPGMAINVTESIEPGTDSSEWNIFAADAINQLTQLYASVLPVTGLVRNALKAVNKAAAPGTQLPDLPVQITATSIGFQPFSTVLEGAKDSVKLMDIIENKTILPAITTITIAVNDKTKSFQLLGDSSKIFDQITREISRLTDGVVAVIEFQDRVTCYVRYLKSLLAFSSAPDLIDEQLKTKEDTIPSFFTYRYPLTDSVPTYINRYSIRLAPSGKADPTDQVYKTSSFIKVAPFHYFSLTAGLAYTPGAKSITSIDTSGGGFKINRDEDRVRLIVGVRYYPFGLFNLRNPTSLFRDRRWVHRLSVIVATGIPKPLENIYAGGGFDVMPGLTLSAGAHFQQQNKYSIQNNQITDRNIGYRAHLFYAITMDPTLLISAVTSIFKN